MTRVENKAARLLEIEALLLAHPQGLTQAELARRLEVNRSTINRSLADLPKHIYVADDGRWVIDRTAYLVNVRLDLNQALALHLATRLLASRMDRQNPHAAAALRKLGVSLERLAPRISQHMLQSADTMDDPRYQRQDPIYLAALERLTLAWAERRAVQVWHRHEDGGVYDYHFCPFFIEPYAVGQSTHVIGLRRPPGAVRTFKIERLERVELLRETYDLPPDFDPRAFLGSAWGIWYTESQPVRVALRFSPGAARRVKETRWHPTQELQDLPDGGLLWQASVAEPREMLSWIRSWGADVEVLEPAEVRNALKSEVGKLARLYQIIKPAESGITYYAHSKEGVERAEWQRLIDHLTSTGDLAFELGRDAGVSEMAKIAGRLHDIGKYSQAFQRRLEGARQPVDHATAGAKEIIRIFQTEPHKTFADLLSYCIAGHHSGLPDYGDSSDVEGDATLLARREKKNLEDYSAYKTEIDLTGLTFQPRRIKPIKDHHNFSVSFLTRMVFSTLVDADWLETETYMKGGKQPRGEYESIAVLAQRLNLFLERFDHPQNAIDQKRTATLKACVEKSGQPQGIFTLTVPTGGGKTLASMAFALNHAVAHGLKRIIYVIPFTSIIEQNAGVFKDCLGEANVLEHHSNFDWEQKRVSSDDQTNSAMSKLKLAAENWDIPIVFTTNVQFFESLFASQKSRCRKLHNMAKSVIIFDEAQMLPREYLKPCMLAVQELVQNYGVSAVLCTATQPLLKQFMPDLPEFTELAPDPQALFDFYKRVQVKNFGKLPDVELLERMNAQPQALCIVNTRKHAKGLFNDLAETGRFHLSTLMCPAHRKATLVDIRERLKCGETCRVVSTQVMEAGIDVDFPVGYRALAGLDSVIQAAGRVNREGKRPGGELFVFEPVSEFIQRTPSYIKQTGDVARSILRDFDSDPISMQAIRAYFQMLITLQDKRIFDAKEILACFDKNGFDFKTAAEKFKLIEENTVAVIIPYNDEAVKWLDELRYTPYPATTLRKLQSYTVNIYEQEFQALNEQGVIELAAEDYAVLKDMSFYDAQTGIILPARDGGAAIFFD